MWTLVHYNCGSVKAQAAERGNCNCGKCRTEKVRMLQEYLQNALLQIDELKAINRLREEKLLLAGSGKRDTVPAKQRVAKCMVIYYSLLKSIVLTNCEKAFKYLSTSSLFEGGQIPPLVFICCIMELLWGSSILHTWIRCSTDCSPSLQRHIGLSVKLNLCK